jgi:hypothetical protein
VAASAEFGIETLAARAADVIADAKNFAAVGSVGGGDAGVAGDEIDACLRIQLIQARQQGIEQLARAALNEEYAVEWRHSPAQEAKHRNFSLME